MLAEEEEEERRRFKVPCKGQKGQRERPAERASGLSLSVFASRADRCDVQTKSGLRMEDGEREREREREARDEDGGCVHDGSDDLHRLTRRKPFLMHFSCKRGNDVSART